MQEHGSRKTVRLCFLYIAIAIALVLAGNEHSIPGAASRPGLSIRETSEGNTPVHQPSRMLRAVEAFTQADHLGSLSDGLSHVSLRRTSRADQPVYRVSASARSFRAAAATPVRFAQVISPRDTWHTSGAQILDSHNRPVRIAGISWYGLETASGAPHGLNHQDFRTILSAVRDNGYNTIRLPFSNQMVHSPTPPSIGFEDASGQPINADLQGLTSLQVMDRIIAEAGALGLRVILDNHRSTAGDGPEANGLWYTAAYPESSWIHDWQALAARYANNSTVVGMDLRNEPHNATTGGSCWGCGSASHDWRLAAERAGNAILRVNPSLLIFVEGTDTVAGDSYWWGGNLEGVRTAPVRLSVPNRLVYSAHDYGPSEYAQSWFNASTNAHSLAGVWTRHWAFISQAEIAPVWLSEFGTVNDAADISSSVPGSEGQWFTSLVDFLQANPNLSWAYWAVNGDDRYGLLDSNFDRTPASPLKQQALASIESAGPSLYDDSSAFATK